MNIIDSMISDSNAFVNEYDSFQLFDGNYQFYDNGIIKDNDVYNDNLSLYLEIIDSKKEYTKKRKYNKEKSNKYMQNDKTYSATSSDTTYYTANQLHSLFQILHLNMQLYNNFTKCMIFPSQLVNHLNCGNVDNINMLLNDMVHNDSISVWNTLAYQSHKYGLSSLKHYFKCFIDSYPDAIFILRKIKLLSNNDKRFIIQCKIRNSYTPIHKRIIEDFHQINVSGNVYDYIDIKNQTNERINELNNIYNSYLSENKLLKIFGKITLNLYIDKLSLKIFKYEDNFEVTSFNVFSP